MASSHPDRGNAKDGALEFVFRMYKATLSPLLHAIAPSRCLYLPTCSEYAYTALTRFGIIRGSWLAVRRIARCHPWAKGGFDPVPDRDPAVAQAAPSDAAQKSADHLP